MTQAIGIMGGTFDPVHYGHLRTALDVAEHLSLDHVRMIPCAVPPHREQPVANAKQRLTLLELAVKHAEKLIVDDRELSRDGPSYTIDTLRSLREEFADKPLYLLLGTDAFLGLSTWHQWEYITDYANIAVMQRPQETLAVPDEMQPWYQQHFKQKADDSLSGQIVTLPVTQLAISATHIRDLLRQGKAPQFLLPDSVIQLIDMLGLYR
jgi:nicotinate-nucleotide adenylyltransferase